MNLPRYFIISDADLAALVKAAPGWEWYAHDLGSIGTAGAGFHVLVVRARGVAQPTWQPMPHILDGASTVSTAHAALLADAKVLTTHTMLQSAQALAKNCCRAFDP